MFRPLSIELMWSSHSFPSVVEGGKVGWRGGSGNVFWITSGIAGRRGASEKSQASRGLCKNRRSNDSTRLANDGKRGCPTNHRQHAATRTRRTIGCKQWGSQLDRIRILDPRVTVSTCCWLLVTSSNAPALLGAWICSPHPVDSIQHVEYDKSAISLFVHEPICVLESELLGLTRAHPILSQSNFHSLAHPWLLAILP